MKFGIKYLLLAVFLFAFALGVRALAIAIENYAVTAIGVLVAALLASSGFTMLRTKLGTAWLMGVMTTYMMCVFDTIERGYIWRNTQYVADPELGMIVTVLFTSFATVVSGLGIKVGVLFRNTTKY